MPAGPDEKRPRRPSAVATALSPQADLERRFMRTAVFRVLTVRSPVMAKDVMPTLTGLAAGPALQDLDRVPQPRSSQCGVTLGR
jgi:hypothetical protein